MDGPFKPDHDYQMGVSGLQDAAGDDGGEDQTTVNGIGDYGYIRRKFLAVLPHPPDFRLPAHLPGFDPPFPGEGLHVGMVARSDVAGKQAIQLLTDHEVSGRPSEDANHALIGIDDRVAIIHDDDRIGRRIDET